MFDHHQTQYQRLIKKCLLRFCRTIVTNFLKLFLVKWVCAHTFSLIFRGKINFLLISSITIALLPFTFRWFIWFILIKIKLSYSWIEEFFFKFLVFLCTILTLFIIIYRREIDGILTSLKILYSKWLTLLKI